MPEDELILMSASEAEERANIVQPSGPSEDVSDRIRALLPEEIAHPNPPEEMEYTPLDTVDFIITVEFDAELGITLDKAVSLFTTAWQRQQGGASIYGYHRNRGKWIWLDACDNENDVFSHLQFSWQLVDPVDLTVLPAANMARFMTEVKKLAQQCPGHVTVVSNFPPGESAQWAARLRELLTNCEMSTEFKLRADATWFDGKLVWDTMYCLGLRWGNMDIFHLDNPSHLGDDALFSVWTSTAPGYFLPEEIIQNGTFVEDLVFGFSVMRTYQPEQVLQALIEAATYAQQRLGGELVTMDDEPLDFGELERFVDELVAHVKTYGIDPGTDSALRLF